MISLRVDLQVAMEVFLFLISELLCVYEYYFILFLSKEVMGDSMAVSENLL